MQPITASAAPQLGELWEFPLGTEGLLGWIAVKRHPDDTKLLLMAPVDTEAFVGQGDMTVALVEAGVKHHRRIVLRGSFACWARSSDFWFRVQGAHVPSPWLAEFSGQIAHELVPKTLPLSEALAFENDVLTPASLKLHAWFDRVEKTLQFDSLSSSEPAPNFDVGPELLAAAGPGVLDSIFDTTDGKQHASVPEVTRELEGVFGGVGAKLRLTPFEVQLEVVHDEMPSRCFFIGPNGGRMFLRWVRHISGVWRSQPAELAKLAAPPLRLVVEASVVIDLRLDFDVISGSSAFTEPGSSE